MTDKEIRTYLSHINRVYPIESILNEEYKTSIPGYYKKLGRLYRRYHSSEGAMHFPIKQTESERHKDKLLYQALAVGKLIEKYNYKTVVELGCGFGFNSIYLARHYPDVEFVAMDITEVNLATAQANAGELSNLTFSNFDFNTTPHSYRTDLVFGVETFCYASEIEMLFRNLSSTLNVNGRVVIFDCYENDARQYPVLTADSKTAYRLLCWGWAFRRFPTIQDVERAVQNSELTIELKDDLSRGIISNYKVLQQTTFKVINYPWLLKFFFSIKILHRFLFMHIVNGVFGVHFVESGFLGYYQFVLKKVSKGNE